MPVSSKLRTEKRMHSSRMRAVRFSGPMSGGGGGDVCPRETCAQWVCPLSGNVWPGGVCQVGVCKGVVCPGEGVCTGGGVYLGEVCLGGDCLPHAPVNRQMPVKILPCPKLHLQAVTIFLKAVI